MAITFEQYLQSLLQSVTTYYTATYSSDTELYNILQMYSRELTSGSIALETVRNNLFVVTCENLSLYNNFGTYFGQGKYTDQTYIEDRYVSGSGTFKVTTPALKVTQVVESSDDWEIASHSSPLTNFPSSWSTVRTLGDTVVFDDNFVSSCLMYDSPYYYTAVRYDPVANEWAVAVPEFAGGLWSADGYDTPLMGLITHRPYLGQGQYDQEYMYYLTFTHTYGATFPPPLVTPSPVHPAYPRAIVIKETPGTLTASGWTGSSSDPVFFSAGGGSWQLDALKNQEQTWTDSVAFHDKLYFGVCIAMWDTSDADTYSNGTPMWAPDATYRYPLLVECDPVTMAVSEVGLAMYIGNTIGNMDFNIHAMAKYGNKLWIDSSQAIEDFSFSDSVNNGTAGTVESINDFESSGSTIFAATGLDARLLYSTDEGNVWNEKVDLSVSGSGHLYSCKEFDAQDGAGSYLYVGTDNKYIFRARAPHTFGSWGQVASLTPANVSDLTTFNDALFAASYQGGLQYVYRTTNGTTWTQVNTSPAEVVNKGGNEFEEFNGYLYAVGVGNNKTIRSSDGTTWENAVDGLGTAGTLVGYRLEAHNDYLYSTNSSRHLVRTSNGTTWNTKYTGFGSQINSILSYQNTLYIGLGNGELWSSTDDGETFTLFQTPSPWNVVKLDAHNGYAFCGTFDVPKGGIFKWGGGSSHYMTTYDGINFADVTSPASAGDTILKMHPYNGQLYAIMTNSTGGYTVRRYNGTTWSTHRSFAYAINTMYEHKGTLLIALINGNVFYLDTERDIWIQYFDIPDLSFSTNGITAFASYTMSPSKVYSFVDDAWYSSEFISSNIIHYAITGAGVSGSTTQWAAIPGYRKQLDFMLDAAMHGGTHQGIVKASNAFTLVNPDIREMHTMPQWKLKSISAPITQLSSNVWQFSNSPSWRSDLWRGAHATFTSGSSISDKIAAGYVILVNDNNTVDVGPIYDPRLLMDLVRPQ